MSQTGSSFYRRHAKLVQAVILLLLPLLFYGAVRAIRSNRNQVEDWLPSTFRETRDLAWFRQHFSADQFVLISWDGCRLGDPNVTGLEAKDDPRIEKLAQTLVPHPPPQDDLFGSSAPLASSDSKYFRTVTTGRRVLDALTGPPSSVPYDDAVRRLQGALIGPDGRQTCVMVTLTPEAVGDLKGAVGRGSIGSFLRFSRPSGALFEALRKCHIDPDEVRLGGPPIDNVSIDEEGEKTLIRLAGLSMGLGLTLAFWSLRSFSLTLIVFFCGVLSGMTAMAIVWFSGQDMDAILMSMPLLVYVLAMSSAVHLVSHYRAALRSGDLDNAPSRAVRHAWKPALLCSVTTAIGLASLYASELAPVRLFGLYSAIGVLAMLVVTFVYVPSALQLFHRRSPWLIAAENEVLPRRLSRAERQKARQVKLAGDPERAPRLPRKTSADRLWTRCAIALIRHYRIVTVASLALIVGVGCGVMKLRTSIDLLKLFQPRSRILQDYAWFEKHLGPLVPLEIVVRFPKAAQIEESEAQKRVSIDGIDLVGPGERAEVDAVERPRDPTRLSFLERAELVALCQEMIERKHGAAGDELVGKSMSPVTFTAPLPRGKTDVLTTARRSATNDLLWNHRSGFVSTGFLHVHPTDASELWRISLRVKAFADVDFGKFLEETRTTIQPVFAAHACRVQVLQRWTQSETPTGPVSIWVPDRGGNLETLPAQQQYFVRALRYLLTREGVTTRIREQRDGELEAALAEGQGLQLILAADRESPLPAAAAADRGAVFLTWAQQGMPSPRGSSTPWPQATNVHAAPETIDAIYTGVVPIVYKSQRKLLDGLIISTQGSFYTITPLMMLVCRGVLAGLVVMIPNTLPVLFVFGAMGWLGIPVDIGSMMAASIALGVAVDDTIHFLTWYRESLAQGTGRRRAIIHAYRHCASATLQSALISGLGLSVFTLSTFTPTQKLGGMMLVILLAGGFAEFIMLPAILAGPMGRVFSTRRERAQRQARKASLTYDLSAVEVRGGRPVDEAARRAEEGERAGGEATPADGENSDSDRLAFRPRNRRSMVG